MLPLPSTECKDSNTFYGDAHCHRFSAQSAILTKSANDKSLSNSNAIQRDRRYWICSDVVGIKRIGISVDMVLERNDSII